MLVFLRLGAAWYALLAVLWGVIAGWSTQDPLFELMSAASFGGLFFIANYLVQLILDHGHERKRFFAVRERLNAKRIVWLTLMFWIPSAVLVSIGVWINTLVQEEITKAI